MDVLDLHPPTGSEVQERKDAALKALAMLDVLQELQANMDWLKSKGIFELEKDFDLEGIELSYKAY